MLRIDINLLFEVINLLILFIAFKFVLFKPVQKIIAQRQEEADKQLSELNAAKEEADAKKAEYENNIRSIEDERKQILNEARKNANKEYAKTIEEAAKKAQLIHEEARIDAEHQKEQILKKVEGEIADMVVDATSKIVAVNTDNKALYNEFLNKAGDEQ